MIQNSSDDLIFQSALSSTWERCSAGELAQILHGVCTMGFSSPENLADRLKDIEDWLRAGFCAQSEGRGSGRVSQGEIQAVLDQLATDRTVVQLAISPANLFLLVTHLQIALNHPECTGLSSVQAKQAAYSMAALLINLQPALKPVIDAGWESPQDISQLQIESGRLMQEQLNREVELEALGVHAVALTEAAKRLHQLDGSATVEEWMSQLLGDARLLIAAMSDADLEKTTQGMLAAAINPF